MVRAEEDPALDVADKKEPTAREFGVSEVTAVLDVWEGVVEVGFG